LRDMRHTIGSATKNLATQRIRLDLDVHTVSCCPPGSNCLVSGHEPINSAPVAFLTL
jgi:hypothetical protein